MFPEPAPEPGPKPRPELEPTLEPQLESAGGTADVTCSCGRVLDLERFGETWLIRGDLVPERSVPVGGFSRELRQQLDAERWWFEIQDMARRRTIVHIVFSPGLGVAEVKPSDLKPLRLTGMTSAAEARRRWIDWFEAGPRAGRPAVRTFRRFSRPAAPAP